MSKTASFKQIRRENKEKSDSDVTGDLIEMFTLYDIDRVDGVESRESDVKLPSEIEESRMHTASADNESGLEIREQRTKQQLSGIEISEQKSKVPLTDFDAHSILDSSARAEEPKSGKVFVKFVKIMTTLDLQSSLLNSGGGSGAEPITQTIKTDNNFLS